MGSARLRPVAFGIVATTVALATWATIAPAVDAVGGGPATAVETAKALAVALTCAGALLLLALAPLRSRLARRTGAAHVARLAVAALTDSLTSLGNHRAFHNDLSAEIQRRNATGAFFTLMAIDLDGLKRINDTQGHQAGDVYIRRVSEAARATVGKHGTIYRTGGDEFMVLLPGLRNWDALALAQRIHQATQEAVGRRAVSIGLTESTGTEAPRLIIHQADVALYEAKRSKLSALCYHTGLATLADVAADAPSHQQKALAAALARAVDAKDTGTRSHAETVAELCVAIGQRLDVVGADLERLRLAGLLHDVGKIGVPDALLQKAGPLASDERDQMREHVVVGHRILVAAELPVEAEWVLRHHERLDGSGYPGGLSGDAIPLESRIIAVADAFEAMVGTRPYHDGIEVGAALAELARNAGTQLDARCVEALFDVVARSDELAA